jgi:hypothetical protein
VQIGLGVPKMAEKVHMLNSSDKSIYCTGRNAGQWLVVSRDLKDVTCLACLRKLSKIKSLTEKGGSTMISNPMRSKVIDIITDVISSGKMDENGRAIFDHRPTKNKLK